MKTLYLTQDRVGIPSGGGIVTSKELEALQKFNLNTDLLTFDHNIPNLDPFEQDQWMLNQVINRYGSDVPNLVHCYSGCLSKTISYLKDKGSKVVYTAAAHDKNESIKEFEDIHQYPFPFKHLTEETLWQEYLKGYLLSDVLVVPSIHSEKAMRSYGCKQEIRIIPHGVDINKDPVSTPKQNPFHTGYLGSYGSDKGVIYLLKAWNFLNYQDNSRLILGGRDSQSLYVQHLIQKTQAPNVSLIGWIDKIENFYNNISCYVQPSISEGFGIEILEAMNFYRPVICSKGAGGSDLIPDHWKFDIRDYKTLAQKIDVTKNILKVTDNNWFQNWHNIASNYSWDSIQNQYSKVWNSLTKE